VNLAKNGAARPTETLGNGRASFTLSPPLPQLGEAVFAPRLSAHASPYPGSKPIGEDPVEGLRAKHESRIRFNLHGLITYLLPKPLLT
jgi:hypothetical protein